MNRDEYSPDPQGNKDNNENSHSRRDDAPLGQPKPPDRSKHLPDLPNPAEVGEDG